MSKNVERRFCGGEVRANGSRGIRGTAVVFGAVADLGGFTEEVAPGALDDALRTSDTVALFNHDASLLLGRKSSGTLRLAITASGLDYEVAEVPHSRADVLEAVTRRDVQGSSFSFDVAAGGETWRDAGTKPHRVITRIRTLYDVSPVTWPAYLATSVSARALKRTGGACPGPGCDPSYHAAPRTDEERRAATARLVAEVGAAPASGPGPSWTSFGKSLAEVRAEMERVQAAGREPRWRRSEPEALKPSRWGSEGRAVGVEEMAHALAAHSFGVRVLEVAVSSPRGGHAKFDRPEGDGALHQLAVIRLAGPVARALFAGRSLADLRRWDSSADVDVAEARSAIGHDPDQWRLVVVDAEDFVRRAWFAIEHATDRLMATPGGVLKGRALDEALSEALRDP